MIHAVPSGRDNDVAFLRICVGRGHGWVYCLLGSAGRGLFGGGPGQGGYFEPEGMVIVVCRGLS